MFSQTVEYALRAAVHLASVPGPVTVEAMSAATKVPAPYLAKVVQSLVRAGLFHSQRGAKGGVTLAKPPADLTILEVVNAVDPIRRIKTCPLGLPSHGSVLCPLHARMDAALAGVEDAFGKTTLAEILAEPTRSPPLCDVRLELGKPKARS
ncbi:MAG: Rrf2 family transcriptional regulator [Gemmataceae bacterium]|nr:Rrf2 family transcriptional regulator [Gemmataceae bacterium]